jgi:hypothetical protein
MVKVGGEVLDQICLPVDYNKMLFEMAHDSAVVGHAGVSQCYARLARNFWAPKLKENLKVYIKSCHVCQTGQYSGGKLRYPLQSIVVPVQETLYRIGIDLIENMPKSRQGNVVGALDAAGAVLRNDQHRKRELFNQGVVKREFQVGDRVWYLWPRCQNEVALEWLGPAVVRKRVPEYNYVMYC